MWLDFFEKQENGSYERYDESFSEIAFDDNRIITTLLHFIYGLQRNIDGQNGKMI